MGSVLGIAAQETRRYRPLLTWRMLAAAAILGLLLGVAWPFLTLTSINPDAGIFVAETDEDNPLMRVLRSDPSFDVRTPITGLYERDEADLLLDRDRVFYDPAREKSEAAARELELAAERWLDQALEREDDEAAAFPVRVNLVFQARATIGTPAPTTPAPGGNQTDDDNATTPPADADQQAILDQTGNQQRDLTPSQVEPPFPMESLLLTFAYLIPMNLIGQFYSGSFFGERTARTGVMLLAAPTTGGRIILGKSLPYILLTLILTAGITVAIGAGLVGFLAALPIVGFVLASSLLLGLLAPHPRALTFLLVTTTVLLSTFLFLPAVFVDIHPVAFMSPVSVISHAIRGTAVGWGPFLYATAPMGLATVVLAAVAVPVYREELLFGPRGMVSKAVAAVSILVKRPSMVFVAGVAAVPFAMALELFVLLFAIALNVETAFLVFLFGAALVEEALKGLAVFSRHRADNDARPWASGLLAGAGFFVGEKLALLLGLVGFGLLDLGPDVLATFGIASSALLVVAPLALHVVTATITAYLARRGAGGATLGVWVAALVHAAYNAAIVLRLGGGL